MRRDVVFMHVPKTAGTSVRVALEQAMTDHVILRDYGPGAISTSELDDLVHKSGRIADFRKVFAQGDRGILLSGHFPRPRAGDRRRRGAALYWGTFHAESFVAFVRDPVDRVISEFAHFVNQANFAGSFEDFLAIPLRVNHTSRLLADVDLDSFGFIGFMEEFEASLAALGEYIGAPLPAIKTNIGTYGSVDAAALREKYRDSILELGRADADLYEKLRRTRSGFYRAPGADESLAGSYMGRVRPVDSVAVGWLVNTAREFICEVDVLQNGEPVATVTADLYRDKLKEEGRSRSGICGFRIALDAFRRGSGSSTFTFRARGSNYELPGSPLQLG
jgi:hypothetical protein